MTTKDEIRKKISLAQRRLRDNRDLNRTERAVATRLLGFIQTMPSHARFGLAWPSQATLASLEDCSDRTIRRAFKKLRGVYFDVTYTSSHGGSHAAFYTPIWGALMGVIDNPDAEQPQAPAAPVQEAEEVGKEDMKPDKTAVQTGQNCPPIFSTSSNSKKNPSLALAASQEGIQAQHIEILGPEESPPAEVLTLVEVEQAIKEFYPRRKARLPKLYQRRDLKRRRQELLADAEAAERATACQAKERERQCEASIRRARTQMEAMLEAKSYDLHHKLKFGGMRQQLDIWLRMETEKPGSAAEDIDRCVAEFWARRKADTAARRAAA